MQKHLKTLEELEKGLVRAASKDANTGDWISDMQTKQKILDLFRDDVISPMWDQKNDQYYGFHDKSLLKPRIIPQETGIRIVPGGTSIRPGTYIAKNVVILPPSYINIGAYIDEGTMVDSHVLVGSCAQIGKKVHLSTAVQIGGVLEPVGSRPVIIEDDCFIGAGAIVVEGVIVREGAVVAPNLVLTSSIPIYDVVKKQIYYGTVPAQAVVVPGTRKSNNQWMQDQGLALDCAIIPKYRDPKTDAATSLEEALR